MWLVKISHAIADCGGGMLTSEAARDFLLGKNFSYRQIERNYALGQRCYALLSIRKEHIDLNPESRIQMHNEIRKFFVEGWNVSVETEWHDTDHFEHHYAL